MSEQFRPTPESEYNPQSPEVREVRAGRLGKPPPDPELDLPGQAEYAAPAQEGHQSTRVQPKEHTLKVLQTLTPREEYILRKRFGIGVDRAHRLEEVGHDFDITRERVRQIEAKALRKLRQLNHSKILRSFVEPTHRGRESTRVQQPKGPGQTPEGSSTKSPERQPLPKILERKAESARKIQRGRERGKEVAKQVERVRKRRLNKILKEQARLEAEKQQSTQVSPRPTQE